MSEWIEKILRKPGDIAENPKVIRLAATGNAAYLIGKDINITTTTTTIKK